eukprot:6344402-Prorocentrum_lima.AAC.1
MILCLVLGALRNGLAMSVVFNVSFFPLVMLNIMRNNPTSTLWVDVGSHTAWLSATKFPQTTILLLALHV